MKRLHKKTKVLIHYSFSYTDFISSKKWYAPGEDTVVIKERPPLGDLLTNKIRHWRRLCTFTKLFKILHSSHNTQQRFPCTGIQHLSLHMGHNLCLSSSFKTFHEETYSHLRTNIAFNILEFPC